MSDVFLDCYVKANIERNHFIEEKTIIDALLRLSTLLQKRETAAVLVKTGTATPPRSGRNAKGAAGAVTP